MERVGASQHTSTLVGLCASESLRATPSASQQGSAIGTDAGRSRDRQHESAEGAARPPCGLAAGGGRSNPCTSRPHGDRAVPSRGTGRTTSGNARYVASAGKGPGATFSSSPDIFVEVLSGVPRHVQTLRRPPLDLEPEPPAVPVPQDDAGSSASCCSACASGRVDCWVCTCHEPPGDLVPARGGLQAVRAQARAHQGGATLRARTSRLAPAVDPWRGASHRGRLVPPSVLLRARLPRPAPRAVGPALETFLTPRGWLEVARGNRGLAKKLEVSA